MDKSRITSAGDFSVTRYIQRNMKEISSLLTLVLPVLTGAVAVTLEGSLIDYETLYPLFCLLASLLVVVFNNIWMQLSVFSSYKYAEILPRLHQITSRDGENLGQYALKDGIARAMLGAVLTHLLLWPTAMVAFVQTTFRNAEISFFSVARACASHHGIGMVLGTAGRSSKQ
jgi:hypothetical protein